MSCGKRSISSVAFEQGLKMKTFETAASLFFGIAAQTLVIGLILVG
ncbi:MAG: hypothetical protein JWM38_2373 [Sphingomonas bacterium]|jgi:hypothetical protein|nr:hypothetical protein [Sphingomonas bacterium]MDB5684028.1 hypothetical protein [Sphingomonas bacterium]MDB5718946.1 hypothetical protein [Sphingomonas bacterium]